MRPPICEICHESFFDEGGLVYFVLDKATLDFQQRSKQPGFVGHPPNAGWFCGKHIGMAKELKNKTIGEAIRIIKEQ